MALESTARRVAVLSIDDFYLTRAERRRLGNDVHPLLQTRGVPGTHDTGLLANSLDRLAALGDGEQIRLPAFDKSTDDRAPAERWPVVTGPVDFVLFEGWCVGTLPQTSEALREPVNELERELDADGRWRGFVNAQLTGPYARMFAKLERLIFLQSPGFDAIRRWRAGQEHKLAASAGPDAPGIMTATELERFIQHYERLTRANLAALPDAADVVLCLDERHGCQESRYNVAG
jgi:D-glycerate 3-kinase